MKQFENIPEKLKTLPQWVCHRDKKPFNPITGNAAKAGRLDKVIADDGAMTSEAAEIVAMMDSYTEVSPSGKGLHIFVKGDIPVNGRRKGFIEVYKAGRYFTMTGNVYDAVKPINECTEQLKYLFQKYFPDLKSEKSALESFIQNPYTEQVKDYLSVGLAKEAVFKALWNGEYQSEKCISESEADLALMGKLMYWCSGDVDMAVEAFMNSPYAAQKDDKHTSKLERSDYLIRTATRAMQGLTSTAASDDEKYKQKYAKGTNDIQEALKRLQPQINVFGK